MFSQHQRFFPFSRSEGTRLTALLCLPRPITSRILKRLPVFRAGQRDLFYAEFYVRASTLSARNRGSQKIGVPDSTEPGARISRNDSYLEEKEGRENGKSFQPLQRKHAEIYIRLVRTGSSAVALAYYMRHRVLSSRGKNRKMLVR